jgi:hypothetical protein
VRGSMVWLQDSGQAEMQPYSIGWLLMKTMFHSSAVGARHVVPLLARQYHAKRNENMWTSVLF